MHSLVFLAESDGYMPHGHCYLWQPGLIGLHVVSDSLIALAYYSIPIMLVHFVRRRAGLDFSWIFLCFALFIVACGTTHLMEIWNVWHPAYWSAGILKAFTAAASIVTAFLLVRLIPKALALPSPVELREANRKLREKAELLEASNQELESFSYTVSHDLRAPLRHIRGFAEVLGEDARNGLSESGQIYLSKITDSAERMDLLIDHLLNFSRMGRIEMEHAFVSNDALVAEAVQELAPDLQGRTVEWLIAPLPKVDADRTLLRQVWANLLSNAVKYTRRSKPARIEVGVRDRGDFWEFHVRDNGAGFDMRHAGKLFGIFERLHEGEFEGTGVGLANVRRIVERHGGKIRGEGEVGRGATFTFTLPKVWAGR